MSETPRTTRIHRACCSYINKTPRLLSLFYDLDLLPEQCTIGTRDWMRMIDVVLHDRRTYRRLERTVAAVTSERDRLLGLLSQAKCPNDDCDGSGTVVFMTGNRSTGAVFQDREQCQWCAMKREAVEGARG